MRHLGHRHLPRPRVVAILTLNVLCQRIKTGKDNLHVLLRIVRRVAEDSWVKPSRDTVVALDDEPMLIGGDKFIV